MISSNRTIQLISFRRSGTHLVLETIKNNFDYSIIDDVAHPGFDLHCSALLRTHFNLIYVYRDVRNVMKSLYNFFLFSDWRIWSGFDADLSNVSFSDFLRGKTKIIKAHCPHFIMIFKDPVRAWVEHTLWLEPLNKHDVKGSPFSIKYENLIANPLHQIKRLSEYLDIPIKDNAPTIIDQKVAQTEKVITEYSVSDMDFLLEKAGTRLLELGYDL